MAEECRPGHVDRVERDSFSSRAEENRQCERKETRTARREEQQRQSADALFYVASMQ